MKVCSIHFHQVHSLLLGVCSSFPEHNFIFGPFWRHLSLSALGSCLVRLTVTPAQQIGLHLHVSAILSAHPVRGALLHGACDSVPTEQPHHQRPWWAAGWVDDSTDKDLV